MRIAMMAVMMEWVNPHSWLHIDVKKPDGTAGTKVTVVGFQAKDGSLRASSRDLKFPDGRKMDLGGSGSATSDPKK